MEKWSAIRVETQTIGKAAAAGSSINALAYLPAEKKVYNIKTLVMNWLPR